MTYPWELAVATRLWETIGDPIYDRTITIKRPITPANTAAGFGALPDQGLSQGSLMDGEKVIATGIIASIQLASSGRNASHDMPSDAPGPIKWVVYLPGSVANSLPLIIERDVIYDDQGRRFQISGFQLEPIGAKIDAVRLLM